jgi:hypothetical protein
MCLSGEQIEYLRLYINYCANHNVAITRVLQLTQQSSKLKSLMLVSVP